MNTRPSNGRLRPSPLRLIRLLTSLTIVTSTVVLSACATSAETAAAPSQPDATASPPGAATTPADQDQSAPAVEARSLRTGDPLGEEWGPFGANPTSIGNYQLVTPQLIAEHAIPCGYDFITQYSDPLDVMLTGHTPTFVTASYVTEEGLANLQAAGDDACTGRVFGEPVHRTVGVIEMRITTHDGAYDRPLKEHYCGGGVDELVCGQHYPGGLTVTSRVIDTDTAVDHDFLLTFLQSYSAANPLVQEYSAYGTIPFD